MLQCSLVHSEVHRQTIKAGLKHYLGHCYQLFKNQTSRGQKIVDIPLGQSCCWVYNKVGGSGAFSPKENLNFQNLRIAIFGLPALMFALLQMLSILNLKDFFGDPPFTHPLKPYFICMPPLQFLPAPYLIKNEQSLIIVYF